MKGKNVFLKGSGTNIFLIILGCIFIISSIFNFNSAWRSLHWSKTSGEITAFNIEDDYVYVDYDYYMDDVDYHGHRISFGDSVSKTSEELISLKNKYGNIGKKIDVYYNPNKPSQSVLEKGNNFGTIFPFFLGIIMLYAGIDKIKNRIKEI